jgi:hypothetical protein
MTIATRALAIAILVAAAPARAQSAEAEVLFREGKKLMKKGSYAAACDKFEASEKLEPSIGAELNLGDCREKAGQIASAWAAFVKAQQTAKRSGDRRHGLEAKRRVQTLEPKLVYLTISVPEDVRVDGLVVKRNHEVLDPAQYDQQVPVDPDDYVVTGEAPGHRPWKLSVTIGSKSKTVEVPRLDDAPPPPREPEPPPTVVQPAPKPAPVQEAPSSFTGRRKLAVALAIIGVAAGAGGAVLGVKAKNDESQADAICPTSRCFDSHAFDLNSKARDDGLLANIGMIGGGALVAGAIVLWITGAPHPRDVAIAPSVGPSTIGIAGTF